MTFSPHVTLDVKAATPKTFEQAVEEFGEWAKCAQVAELRLQDGWVTVDQQLAEQLLLCNPVGANRKAKLASVRYYAEQMLADDWQKTGQALSLWKYKLTINRKRPEPVTSPDPSPESWQMATQPTLL